MSKSEKHIHGGKYSDYCDECQIDEQERRRILDAFHSRQVSRYLEMLKTVPNDGLPKSGPELCADYLEFLDL